MGAVDWLFERFKPKPKFRKADQVRGRSGLPNAARVITSYWDRRGRCWRVEVECPVPSRGVIEGWHRYTFKESMLELVKPSEVRED